MVYDFSTRLDRVGTRMKELHNNSLTYTRGVTNITVENFTPEKTDADLLTALGVVAVNEIWQDFVFDTADLSVLDPAAPRVNDKITWGTLTFIVTSLGDETFKYTTSSRLRLRVHTKQING